MLKKNYVIFTHSGNLEMSNTCCIHKDVMNMGNFLNVDIKPLCYTIETRVLRVLIWIK